jgi:protein tyrosine phosphatase (PTP) superfamily phosphohydrolase (DUF442 family)
MLLYRAGIKSSSGTNKRRFPIDTADLTTIYNFRRLSGSLISSGQPTEEELAAVAAAGVEVVINLALHETYYSLPDERHTAEELGMVYEHIPVMWDNPQRADFEAFCDAMERHADRRVYVHCAANFRASAFIMLYRVLRLNWRPEDALPDMDAIWQPYDAWPAFIESILKLRDADK